jgi:RNA polymerase sigma factor (sigma-70 family)
MRNTQTNSLLRCIRQVAATALPNDLADQQLLECFISERDETAFATLVRRHGPMVRRLCLRVLHHEQDAEDVFQATFLVLSRKAATLRPRDSLAGWLHRVAYRTAQKARIGAARRRKREGSAPGAEVADPLAQITVREAQAVLDQELARLPDKFRVPLVLCYLEGLTRDEAAQQIGWPLSLLKTRLEQARERLQGRLVSRGLTPAGALVVALVDEATAAAVVPPALMHGTVKLATMIGGSGAAASLVPAKVAALTEGIVKAMFMTKLKTAALGLLGLSVLTLGAGWCTERVLAGKPDADEAPDLERARGDVVRLPPPLLTRLGIHTEELKPRPAQPRVLHLAGSTAFSPERLFRVRCPFTPVEVREIGKPDGQDRELRPGDIVRKGQVLAVVDSVDVYARKADLFDALVHLSSEEAILKNAERAAKVLPQFLLRALRRRVEADHNVVARALRCLEAWRIPDNDIADVRQEAEKTIAKPKPETQEMYKARVERWGKVVLRAPNDGVLIERNLHATEVVLDGAVNLFQIASIDELLVLAQVSDENLPSLEAFKASELRWTVQTASGEINGPIDDVEYVIDPKRQVVTLKGRIDNKKHQLRPGQFIQIAVALPSPVEELVLPAAALVEEGGQTFVFVQADAKKLAYEQRRVFVVRRGKDAVHIRARLTPEQERQGFQTVSPREQVVTSGALGLKAILDDLKAARER